MSEARQEKAPFWLRDNFAPTFEERTDYDLKVIGHIPESLQGTLLRNGANPQSGESAHWFLGNGMLHGVRIEAGQAKWYRNRYVKTPLFLKPDGDVMDGLGDMTMSAANTNVIQHAGKIMALEEGHWPFEVSNELETVGPNNYERKLEGAMTAHPKICPETGELLAFSYGMTPPYLTYLRASASGELLQTEQIEVPGATMIHDFNVTRNFVIFMDLPAVWNFEGMATTGLPILWDESYGARLGVMPRNGGNAEVVWYEIDPCYVFHPLNAYENGDKIVIDVCRMDDTMKPGSSAPPMLHRWTIDQASGRVTETQLDDRVVDFPRVADAVVGLKHQYGYCAAFAGSAPYGEGLIKYNLETGTSEYRHLDGGQASEAVFVKDPAASGEDGGFLLSYVYQPEIDQSEVLILNAQDMLGEPVARIQIPARVPAGFHGNWIGD